MSPAMDVIITTEVEFFFPDKPLLISPHWTLSHFPDQAPEFIKTKDFVAGWFKPEIEAEVSMMRVCCDKREASLVFLPKNIWNTEPRIIVNETMTDKISRNLLPLFGSEAEVEITYQPTTSFLN